MSSSEPPSSCVSCFQALRKGVALCGWKLRMGTNAPALQWAPEHIRSNREVVIKALRRSYGCALQWASEELRNDREVVREAALYSKGLALKWASEQLQDDRETVLLAVAHRWYALQYASEKLRNDFQVVMTAVVQSNQALQWASTKLLNDPELIMAAVTHRWHALESASEQLRSDRDFMMTVVDRTRSARVANFASATLSTDAEFLNKCLQHLKDGECFARFALLSGRSCLRVFHYDRWDVHDLLRCCARKLEIEPDRIHRAKLVYGVELLPSKVSEWRNFLVDGQVNDISTVFI